MFRRFGAAQVLSVARGEIPMSKSAHRAVFHYTAKEGMIYVRSRAISSRCNDNYDYFGPGEIAAAYRTFVGKPVFVNHHNDDHKRARGVIIDAALHKDVNPDGSPDTWAEVLMEVDGKTYPKLGMALLSGAIDRTSMGCDVKISKCSICHNEATNPLEYCQHIPAKKGQRVYQLDPVTRKREGKLVFEICSGLSFFENSLLVEPPADPTAVRLGSIETGAGLEHMLPGLAATYLPNEHGGYTVDFGDTGVGKTAGLTPPAASRDLLSKQANLLHEALREDRLAVGLPFGLPVPLDHVGGVHGVGAQDPMFRVVAQRNVAGVPDDLAARYRANQLAVAPAMRANRAALGIGEREATVAAVEGAAGPQPAGIRPAAGVDVGQVPLHLGSRTSEPAVVRGPADHDAYFIRSAGKYDPDEDGPWSSRDLDQDHHVISTNGWTCDTCGHEVNGQTDEQGIPDQPGDSVRHISRKVAHTSDEGYLLNQAQDRADRRPADLGEPGSLRRHLAEAHGFAEGDFGRGAHTDEDGALPDAYHWADKGPLDHEEMRAVHDHEHAVNGADWGDSWTDDGRMHAHAGLQSEAAGGKSPKDMDPDEYAAHQASEQAKAVEGKAWNAKHPVAARHIVNHWNLATDDEKSNGENWYRDAHELTKHIASDTKTPMHTMAGLMSNYSPQTHWSTNIMNAARVARTKAGIGGKGSGVFASGGQKKAADRMLGGEHYDSVLGGPKTKAFAHLIEHGKDADPEVPKVVVDRHALSVAAGSRANDAAYTQAGLGGKRRYEEVSQAYHKAAKTISKQEGRPIAAHQVQAATWLVRQRLNEEHDRNLSASAGSRSATIAQGAIKQWNEYAGEHHPGAMGKEPGTGYSKSQPEDVQHVQQMKNEGIGVPKVAHHRDGTLSLARAGYLDRLAGPIADALYAPMDMSGQMPRTAALRSESALDAGLVAQAMLKLGYGETKAPTDVDTLRDENCPVCGNDSAFNGTECQVCGYIGPPKAFGDPDVDKAKQLDTLKQDVNDELDTADPSRNGALVGDGLADDEQAMEGGGDPESPTLACTNCGNEVVPQTPQTTTSNPDQIASQGPAEGDACQVCQQGQLASTGQPPEEEDPDEEEDDPDKQGGPEDAEDDTAIGDGKLPASKNASKHPASANARAQKYRPHKEEGTMPPTKALAVLAAQQNATEQLLRRVAFLEQRDVRRDQQMARKDDQIARLTAGIVSISNLLPIEHRLALKQAMIQKHADEQNPAQPVLEPSPEPASESTVDAKTPEAFADVTAPGMVPGSNQDVAADAVSTAYTPGQDIPSPGIKQLVDVTRPVDGTQGPRPLSETKTETDVRVGNPMNPQVAFPLHGDFAQAQRTSSATGGDGQLRTMASLRLARLQIQAQLDGTENLDDLTLGQTIASSDRSTVSINEEIETLNRVSKAASRNQGVAQAPRGVVPRLAGGVQRTMPSLAATSSLRSVSSATEDAELAAALI